MNTDPTFRSAVKSPIARRVAFIAALPVALLIGVGMGSSGDPVTPDPITNTETKEVEVEKIVEVERTPDACIAALDAADKVNAYSGEGFGLASEAMTAAGNFDMTALEDANIGLNDLLEPLSIALDEYNVAAAECRADGV